MGTFEPNEPGIKELSTKFVLNTLGSKGRQKKIIAFGLVGVVVVGAGVFAATRVMDAHGVDAVNQSWGDLNACMLGDEPLAAGESPSARVANVRLAVIASPADQRFKANEVGWPKRCAPYASSLSEHAGGAETGGAALEASAKALALVLRDDASGTAHVGKQIDQVWKDAAASKLKALPAPTIPACPKPAKPVFSSEAFRALPQFLSGSITLASIRTEPFASASGGTNGLRFLVDDESLQGGPVLCTATATSDSIQCVKLPPNVAKLSPGIRLVGTNDEGARPYLFAGDRGQLGIFPPDGKDQVAAIAALGASARKDGSLVAIRKEGLHEVRLLYVPPASDGGGAPAEKPLLDATEIDNANDAGLFWDWLVYKGAAKPGAATHLFARKLSDDGQFATAVDVGEIADDAKADPAGKSEKEPRLSACRTADSMMVRARKERGDQLVFYTEGKWASPVSTDVVGGAMTCRGREAIITHIQHDLKGDKDFATVVQNRCTASGCASVPVALRELLSGVSEIMPSDAKSLQASDVNGQLLLVWNAGQLGGLRMRFAAADRMKTAEETVIVAGRDERDESQQSPVTEARVLSTDKYALLFINTTSGIRALRVESSGKLTPMKSAP